MNLRRAHWLRVRWRGRRGPLRAGGGIEVAGWRDQWPSGAQSFHPTIRRRRRSALRLGDRETVDVAVVFHPSGSASEKKGVKPTRPCSSRSSPTISRILSALRC